MKEFAGKGRTKKIGLAEFACKWKKAVDPLVVFSKSTEVGGREGGERTGAGTERRDDQVGGSSCLRTD